MNLKRTWSSAEGSAVVRACESMLPADKRLFYDPWAKYFLSFKYSGFIFQEMLGKIVLFKNIMPWYTQHARKCIIWYIDRIYPGGYGFVIVRTRYFDDYLKFCLKAGINQLIILGSGFDARAYRFQELKNKIDVFEVDQRGTMDRKIKLVKKIFGDLPDHVNYVTINFEKDSLADRLITSGYDPKRKSLFIWEAVSGYLTRKAVDETLEFVAMNSGFGSSIIFDYPDISFINYPNQSYEAAKLHSYHSKIGEPPKFGVDKNEIVQFLSKRGYFNIKSMNAKSLKKRYIEIRNDNIAISPFFHFATADILKR